jgi:hypothetical protein
MGGIHGVTGPSRTFMGEGGAYRSLRAISRSGLFVCGYVSQYAL